MKEGFLKKMYLRLSKLLVALSAISFVFAPVASYALTDQERLNQKEQEIARLESQLNSYQSKANALSSSRMTLQKQIAFYNASIKESELRIEATSAKIDAKNVQIQITNNQIKRKNAELAYQKSVLNEALTIIYEEGNNGFLEDFVQAKTLSDLISRSEYLNTVENKIEVTMATIQKLRAELNSQKRELLTEKSDLEDLRSDLNAKKIGLQNQKSAKNRILQQTLGQEARFQSLIRNANEQKTQATAALIALREAILRNGGGGAPGGSGGYPWLGYPKDAFLDPYGFYIRECTSYAAWKWNAVYGKSWYNTRPGSGSAWNWPNLARDQGYSVSKHPRVGAMAVWGFSYGGYGHVAIIEAVYGDGSFMVSEYNMDLQGHYFYGRVVHSYNDVNFIY